MFQHTVIIIFIVVGDSSVIQCLIRIASIAYSLYGPIQQTEFVDVHLFSK